MLYPQEDGPLVKRWLAGELETLCVAYRAGGLC